METEKFIINENGQLYVKEGSTSVLFHDGLFKNLGVNIKEIIINNEGDPSVYVFHSITQKLKVLFDRPYIGGILISGCDDLSFEYNIDRIDSLEIRKRKKPINFPGKINNITELNLYKSENLRKVDFTNIKTIGKLDLNINMDAIKVHNNLKIIYPVNFNENQNSFTDEEYGKLEIIKELLDKYRGT